MLCHNFKEGFLSAELQEDDELLLYGLRINLIKLQVSVYWTQYTYAHSLTQKLLVDIFIKIRGLAYLFYQTL